MATPAANAKLQTQTQTPDNDKNQSLPSPPSSPLPSSHPPLDVHGKRPMPLSGIEICEDTNGNNNNKGVDDDGSSQLGGGGGGEKKRRLDNMKQVDLPPGSNTENIDPQLRQQLDERLGIQPTQSAFLFQMRTMHRWKSMR